MPRTDRDRIELDRLEGCKRAAQARGSSKQRTRSHPRVDGACDRAHRCGQLRCVCAPIPVRVFDMAASLLIVSEAGGVATDLKGNSLAKLPARRYSDDACLRADSELHAIAHRALNASVMSTSRRGLFS